WPFLLTGLVVWRTIGRPVEVGPLGDLPPGFAGCFFFLPKRLAGACHRRGRCLFILRIRRLMTRLWRAIKNGMSALPRSGSTYRKYVATTLVKSAANVVLYHTAELDNGPSALLRATSR